MYFWYVMVGLLRFNGLYIFLFIQCVILGIVWNAFCNAFTSGLGLEVEHVVTLLTMLPVLHAASLTSLFSFFQMDLFGFTAGEAKAATFCGAHKTLAFGLPLINTIFEGNANLGEHSRVTCQPVINLSALTPLLCSHGCHQTASYCAPLMIMHPLQIVIGSLMMPYLSSAKIKSA
jgi:sodium/bile acid cotransporter 7